MYVTIGDKHYAFQKVELDVLEMGIENTFAKFDKVTLRQLVTHKKYVDLASEAQERFGWILDKPAGTALMAMKYNGDPFYKLFLNNYGDLCYSRFIVKGKEEHIQKNGVYNIVVDNELVFSGVSARPFKERLNQHIGNVSAKGCYKDGTATHCHVNARLTELFTKRNVQVYVCPIEDKKEMNQLKNAIIRRFEPTWNLRVVHAKSSALPY